MVSKHFLTAGVLCATVLLFGADASLFGAGHGGGGGGHGGGGHGGGYGHGGYGGGYGRGYGGGYGGFYGGGLFYGDYLYGGGYPGYYAPYAYPAPTYYGYPDPGAGSYAPPIASSPSTAPRTSYYYPPTTANYAAPVPVNAATFHVVLPDPQATVLFDGRKTATTGSERYYQSPDLTPGGSYQYVLRATWMQDGHQVTQEKTVSAIPGKTTDVVFTRSASEGVPTVSTAK